MWLCPDEQANLTRMTDLFRQWDTDGNGTINKKEFCRAMNALGFAIPEAECNKVFETLDEDKSGSLEYKELNKMLRIKRSEQR